MMKWSKNSWSYREDEWNSPPRRRFHVRRVRPSCSPPTKKSQGKGNGKGKVKDGRGWWRWVPNKTAPWRSRDEDDNKDAVEVVDDAEEEDYWGPWNDTWWSHRTSEREEGPSSANSKKSSTPPKKRRASASAGDATRAGAASGPSMGMWRNLLGIADYGETKMRALPEQQLEVVQQRAMALQSDELTQVMASWARFIAVLLAEVNHAMVESKKKQALNREQWTLPDKKKDGDKDEGPHGNPDGGNGDLTSMMQGNKPTLVFTQMWRLRQGMELLPPRRRSVDHSSCCKGCARLAIIGVG